MKENSKTSNISARIYQYLVALVPELDEGIEAGYKLFSLLSKDKKALLTFSKSRNVMYVELGRKELTKFESISAGEEKITHYRRINSPSIVAVFNLESKTVETLCIDDQRSKSKFSEHVTTIKDKTELNIKFVEYLENEFINKGYKVGQTLTL